MGVKASDCTLEVTRLRGKAHEVAARSSKDASEQMKEIDAKLQKHLMVYEHTSEREDDSPEMTEMRQQPGIPHSLPTCGIKQGES